MVERCVRDAEVASSNLVASILFLACFWLNAGIAQSVEHFTRNEGVVSSSLISSSTRSLMSFQWKRDQAFFSCRQSEYASNQCVFAHKLMRSHANAPTT